MSIVDLRVRQEGRNVLVLQDGKVLFDMPYEAALQLAKALQAKAKCCEQLVRAERVIADQVVLLKAGVPLNLSGPLPKIFTEAAKQLPGAGNVPSRMKVGTPGVTQHPPRS